MTDILKTEFGGNIPLFRLEACVRFV